METNTRTRRGISARFSLVGGLRGFLAAAGLIGAMVAVAEAQQSGNSRAGLLPPRPLDPGEAAPLARGAIPDTPISATTPVPRSTTKASVPSGSGPAWLSGIDPNVLPAVGSSSTGSAGNKSSVTTAGPFSPGLGSSAPRPTPPLPREESTPGKGIERFKGNTANTDRSATDAKTPPDSPNANTPFRGTTANGAPVYAGPPAYRWYGYGSVTPGANPYAPSGLYPKASANWYSVTGATPGAFPVPVMNPLRQPPGIDPPSYAGTSPNRVTNVAMTNPALPVPSTTMPVITTTNPGPINDVKVTPIPLPAAIEPPKLPTPRPVSQYTPLPAPTAPISIPLRPDVPTIPTAPVGVPTIAVPPGLGAMPPLPQQPLLPAMEVTEPAASPAVLVPPAPMIPPLGPSEPVTAPEPPRSVPLTVTKPAGDDLRWQPGEQPGTPEGTWAPAVGQPKPLNQPGAMKPGEQLRIRAQMPDERVQADPTINLIRSMCSGRATGIEVRWTGTKRLAVCFEAATEPEAARLVKEISARGELTALQIDFCVLVK